MTSPSIDSSNDQAMIDQTTQQFRSKSVMENSMHHTQLNQQDVANIPASADLNNSCIMVPNPIEMTPSKLEEKP